LSRYSSRSDVSHGGIPAVGVLVSNLGTPAAPTRRALRRYLREFLADPRVVEVPRALWWFILHAFILPTRPQRSARLYARIWAAEGSPLLVTSRRIAEGLHAALRAEIGSPLHLALGMRYGSPSVAEGLRALRERGCTRILVLPLYPQAAAATSGSTFDAVAAELVRWRRVPELGVVQGYHADAAYIAALAASVRAVWSEGGPSERLLFSYHGLPRRYLDAGDPYHCFCHATTRLVVEALALPAERALTAFQSRFGREEWMRPYTDETLRRWGSERLASVDVICPGFAADCLETLDEIAVLSAELFHAAGGGRFRYVPALNDGPEHVAALAALCMRKLADWVGPRGAWDAGEATAKAAAARARAIAMGGR
jgi:protoporphyrin/coproporphyrin ferrochelatase